jgi:hypothetical protein
VRESARALKLLVVTICKCSVNAITKPNPAIVTHTRDNMYSNSESDEEARTKGSYVARKIVARAACILF